MEKHIKIFILLIKNNSKKIYSIFGIIYSILYKIIDKLLLFLSFYFIIEKIPNNFHLNKILLTVYFLFYCIIDQINRIINNSLEEFNRDVANRNIDLKIMKPMNMESYFYLQKIDYIDVIAFVTFVCLFLYYAYMNGFLNPSFILGFMIVTLTSIIIIINIDLSYYILMFKNRNRPKNLPLTNNIMSIGRFPVFIYFAYVKSLSILIAHIGLIFTYPIYFLLNKYNFFLYVVLLGINYQLFIFLKKSFKNNLDNYISESM